MTEKYIKSLIAYGLKCSLIEREDAVYTANSLMDIMKYEPDGSFSPFDGEELKLSEILSALLDDAVERGIIEDGIASRDLFSTRIMGCLTPRPSEVIRTFRALYEESPEKATSYFYRLSRDSDYIRTYRIEKDIKWTADTEYGTLDITINLSKPEKDPRAIAAAAHRKDNAYPRCLLCVENEGYAGRLDHPARQNIRLIPVFLAGEEWYMQYSPYVYYNEHCIVLSKKHLPMSIDIKTFRRLLDFISIFPHYTIGSNADLPIVGGSILSHEHFQGGRYVFPMEKAGVREKIVFRGYEDIYASIPEWPLSVIRIRGNDPERLVSLADRILSVWRGYSDEALDILDKTEGVKHNTVTPIARRRGSDYELDLVLRNNRTNEEHPLGIFHPHAELHHIKKENIGLIEVMGLAILPARLEKEMRILMDTILKGKELSSAEEIGSHIAWGRELLDKYPEFAPSRVKYSEEVENRLKGILEAEIGEVFKRVLEQCGVFKNTAAGMQGFMRFIGGVNKSLDIREV